jgi:uncharacterized protein YndB with AHSA1/START domain
MHPRREASVADQAEAAVDGETERTLIIERVFRASPDRVFRAWTDPAVLVNWWGPEGYTTPEFTFDVRPGGAWRTVMRSPDGNPHRVSGIFREISPPNRLVLTWAWEEEGKRGHETEIELTFSAVAEGTRMLLIQRVFQSLQARDNHRWGWTEGLNKLGRLFV